MTKPVLQHGDSSKPKTQKKPNKDASKRGRKRKVSEVSEMIDHEENSNKKIRETLMNEEANELDLEDLTDEDEEMDVFQGTSKDLETKLQKRGGSRTKTMNKF
jgi:hypothetical protein